MKNHLLIAEYYNSKKNFQVEVWTNNQDYKIARQDEYTKEIFIKEFSSYAKANLFLTNQGYQIFRYIYYGEVLNNENH